MGHHGRELPEMNEDDINRILKDFGIEKAPKSPLGATGKFPDGKIDPNDEGEIAIGVSNDDNRVILHFGKQITWIGFTPEQAKEVAQSLIKHAEMTCPLKKPKS